jgi:exo-1,4-beta-D-glucosaminidase
MGCLIESGTYKDDELWFSDNLNKVNWGQFRVPWVYRNEFSLAPKKGQHYFLETNGITSRADLFFNGKKIADKAQQAGSFGGQKYDISSLVGAKNALAANVYPADFNLDLVYGFVDWSPHAPDNGTGIWRDITIKQTGPVALGPMSVSVDIEIPVESNPAKVTVRAKVQNLEDHAVQVDATSVLSDPSGGKVGSQTTSIKLGPNETKLVALAYNIKNPKIWWPKFWGGQPLYTAQLTVAVANQVSDLAQEAFGIRTVTSALNRYNDTMFTVNGHPFQVVGGGYSPDMFFRWDASRWANIMKYSLDMGLNTIRLEGMMEHPELYRMADEAGMMIIAGFVCCSKWEAWSYNTDIDPNAPWTENDYETANATMRHEAAVMQTHPSMLSFLIGSDFWPNDRAAKIYVDALKDSYWQTPVIASASKRGYPAITGPSGMKMDGPYDWVPPNYWYDTEPSEDRLGAAFGFGSELGPGVGTPEISSLKKFLTQGEMDALWKTPNANYFHMSTNTSSFYNRKIYNKALIQRYGAPESLDDYIFKAQVMDYEAIRAQHEGYSARWNQDRPATGTIYWMLNNAWPSLHWNQFDHYLHPAGSYFGTKIGSRLEHVAYDYVRKEAWIINHSLNQKGKRTIAAELIDLNGNLISKSSITTTTVPNKSGKAATVCGVDKIKDVGLLRLVLSDDKGRVLSRNVYWLTKSVDVLDWPHSTWYHTPVTKFPDFGALSKMKTAQLSVKTSKNGQAHSVVLENQSNVPAFFVRLNLVDRAGEDVNPAIWSDNYVTLWPKEKLTLTVSGDGREAKVLVNGGNVEAAQVSL